jgi:hypothetical protein
MRLKDRWDGYKYITYFLVPRRRCVNARSSWHEQEIIDAIFLHNYARPLYPLRPRPLPVPRFPKPCQLPVIGMHFLSHLPP